MIKLHQLDKSLTFPNNNLALDDPNGLLAFGGDLSVERLKLAYYHGIFPWFSEGEPILWWSPVPRGVMPLSEFHCSRNLSKFVRNHSYRVTLNHGFADVIEACSSIPRKDDGTWITETMLDAYLALHEQGYAHSIEVWDRETLVGGLYGVSMGGVFCGESMFSYAPNTSKLAFYHLVKLLESNGADFIDCQMQNPHLQRLGCVEVSRQKFLTMLGLSRDKSYPENAWISRCLNSKNVCSS
jgi:leucyl/phenylalanyl-tRNA--protein transferase